MKLSTSRQSCTHLSANLEKSWVNVSNMLEDEDITCCTLSSKREARWQVMLLIGRGKKMAETSSQGRAFQREAVSHLGQEWNPDPLSSILERLNFCFSLSNDGATSLSSCHSFSELCPEARYPVLWKEWEEIICDCPYGVGGSLVYSAKLYEVPTAIELAKTIEEALRTWFPGLKGQPSQEGTKCRCEITMWHELESILPAGVKECTPRLLEELLREPQLWSRAGGMCEGQGLGVLAGFLGCFDWGFEPALGQ